jgi:hypothetical protein
VRKNAAEAAIERLRSPRHRDSLRQSSYVCYSGFVAAAINPGLESYSMRRKVTSVGTGSFAGLTIVFVILLTSSCGSRMETDAVSDPSASPETPVDEPEDEVDEPEDGDVARGRPAETGPSTQILGSPRIAAAGGRSVPVYKFPRSGRVTYGIVPVVHVEWDVFESQLPASCGAQGVPQTITASFPVQLMTDEARVELAGEIGKIEKDPATSVDKSQVLFYPFNVIRVTAGDQLPKPWPRTLRRIPEQREGVVNAVTHDWEDGPKVVAISGSCEELRRIYETEDIGGYLLFNNKEVDVNSTYAAYSGLVDDRAFSKLLTDETQTGENTIVSHIKGGGGGIALGPIKFGGSSQTATLRQFDTTTRFVSANLVQDAIRKAVANVTLITRSEGGSGVETNAVVEKLLEVVLERAAEPVDATFVWEKNQVSIQSDYFTHVFSQSDVNTLKSKPKSTIDTTDERTASAGDVKGTTKDTFKMESSDDITRESTGSFRPIKAKLYALSKTRVRNAFEAHYEEQLVKEGTVQSLELDLDVVNRRIPQPIDCSARVEYVIEVRTRSREYARSDSDLSMLLKGDCDELYIPPEKFRGHLEFGVTHALRLENQPTIGTIKSVELTLEYSDENREARLSQLNDWNFEFIRIREGETECVHYRGFSFGDGDKPTQKKPVTKPLGTPYPCLK